MRIWIGEEEVSTSNTLDCPGYVNRPIDTQSLFGPVSNRTRPPDPPENGSAGIRAGGALPHVDRLAGSISDIDESAARKSCVALQSVAAEHARNGGFRPCALLNNAISAPAKGISAPL